MLHGLCGFTCSMTQRIRASSVRSVSGTCWRPMVQSLIPTNWKSSWPSLMATLMERSATKTLSTWWDVLNFYSLADIRVQHWTFWLLMIWFPPQDKRFKKCMNQISSSCSWQWIYFELICQQIIVFCKQGENVWCGQRRPAKWLIRLSNSTVKTAAINKNNWQQYAKHWAQKLPMYV